MAGMHDDYLQQQMESTLQKVFGIAAQPPQQIDDAEQRPPPKRARAADETYGAVRHTEFPSTSIADFFNLNGSHPSSNRLPFPSTSELAYGQPQPSNSETWARLLAAGTTNTISPLTQLDEAFVEIFADKVATKVAHALSPQMQQIRTAIIGLARLVEANPPTQVTSSLGEKRTQSPATPIPLHAQQPIIDAQAPVASATVSGGVQQAAVSSLASTATAPIVTTKKRNPSPSKAETARVDGGVNVPVNENEAPVGIKASSTTKAANGPTSGATKSEKKTGDGKSNPKRSVKEVPDMYRIIKLDDLAVHFNMSEKLCLLCRETFTESHLHSVKRHMYRKHRIELDIVLQRKTNDPTLQQMDKTQLAAGDLLQFLNMKTDLAGAEGQDQNELIDVVEVGNVGADQQPPKYQSGIPL